MTMQSQTTACDTMPQSLYRDNTFVWIEHTYYRLLRENCSLMCDTNRSLYPGDTGRCDADPGDMARGPIIYPHTHSSIFLCEPYLRAVFLSRNIFACSSLFSILL